MQKYGLQTLLLKQNGKVANFVKDVKIWPHKHVYQGSPLYCLQKLKKLRERTLFREKKIKTWILSTKVKISPQEHVYQGSPPLYCLQKLQKLWERTLFWSRKIKTKILSKNVKISPAEHVYQGSPPILPTKTPKTVKANSVLRVEN